MHKFFNISEILSRYIYSTHVVMGKESRRESKREREVKGWKEREREIYPFIYL